MELSKKQKHLSQFFVALLKYALSFEHFEKKNETDSLCIYEITDCKKSG